jgi:hypothetical protein
MERSTVYAAINSERDYQQARWPGHSHSVEEYLLYIEHYAVECRRLCTTLDFTRAGEQDKALDVMRKITTLGVACGEEHGFRARRS